MTFMNRTTKVKTMFQMLFLSLIFLPANAVYASGGDMPWNTVIDTIKDSLQNGFVQSAAVIAVIITGLMIAFGEVGGWVSSLARIIFGLALALGAASFVTTFFESGTGVIF